MAMARSGTNRGLSTRKANEAATFLGLPTELRLEIYKHLFHPGSSKILITGGHTGGYAKKQLKPSHKAWPILLSCRAVYHEASASYWSRSRVHVYTTWRQLLSSQRQQPVVGGGAAMLRHVEHIYLRLYTLSARWGDILDGLVNSTQFPRLKTLVVRDEVVALEPAHFRSLPTFFGRDGDDDDGEGEAHAAVQQFYEEAYLPLIQGRQENRKATTPLPSSTWDLLSKASTFPQNRVVCVPLIVDETAESMTPTSPGDVQLDSSCAKKVLICNLGNGKISLVSMVNKFRGIENVLD